MTLRAPLAAAVVLLLTACGGTPANTPANTPATTAGTTAGSGPEAALKALAESADARDDEAVRKLVCPEEWTQSRTIAAKKAELEQLDPRLADLRYRITAKEVRDQSDTTATGVLAVEVEGKPDDLSPEAESGLETMEAPIPVALMGPNQTIKLVKQGDTWVACR
ncbi:hypothetical protein ABZ816_34200 [Actinosynnema sp. NPDC047251]|uniref:Putative secreted protein n=1 Tax=Saccharothrix espanaensis (strain ATCC 51144 / DSM 44229 / JCM 9112 / NBRC 15066 / NRRL 15764) TaxID=1179773 RepID=K0K6P9_SACES|nr:hypothetical protein [Saccharothrix espanaensis]CCH32248.1 putative secreted protein [Saccharothrix espanaensis DSM 44229]